MYGLDCAQQEKVAAYWWRRAEGEITSYVAFQSVLEDLKREGSPSAVLALAERAVADEQRHALWCRDWATRFGYVASTELRPRSQRAISFPGADAELNRLLRITLCCFTETIGCFVLRSVRPSIQDTELRALNQRHLADELAHSRVGWGHLSTLDTRRKDLLRARVGALLQLLPAACCEGQEEELEELVPFGYFTPSLLRRAHDDAIAEVILPGLEHLGLEGAA